MLVGIDIGGTKTRLVLADSPHKIKHEMVFATPEDKSLFLSLLSKEFTKITKDVEISAIGIACKGPIDRQAGEWLDMPVVEQIKQHISCPIVFEHDATAGGIAEARLGAGKGHRVVVYVTISTGIGTAIIIDGQPLPGTHNSEGGHQVIQARPFPGKEWQELASGEAIAQRYGKIARDIHSADDWQTIAQDFAVGIYNIITIFEPDTVVLAGGVAVHYDRFEQPLKQSLAKLRPLYPPPPIKLANFVEIAPAVGALILAAEADTTDAKS